MIDPGRPHGRGINRICSNVCRRTCGCPPRSVRPADSPRASRAPLVRGARMPHQYDDLAPPTACVGFRPLAQHAPAKPTQHCVGIRPPTQAHRKIVSESDRFPLPSLPRLPLKLRIRGKSRVKEGLRSGVTVLKLFGPGPYSARIPGAHTRRVRLYAPAPKAGHRAPSAPLVFRPGLPQFPRRFPAVTAVAKAFQVAPIRKDCPVALVVYDVVHVCGIDTLTPFGTLPAEWLPQELTRPQVIHPG